MKIEIVGRKMTVTEAMSTYATRKMEKLAKYFGDEPTAQITFSSERDRKSVV